MALITIVANSAKAFNIGPDVWTVEVAIGNGKFAYFKDFDGYPYCPKEEADHLAETTNIAGAILPNRWTDGYCNELKA